VIEHDVALSIHCFYASELDAGRRACERLLARPLEQETERMVRRNRLFYTQTLDELVACRFVRIDVEPANDGWSLFNPTLAVHEGELVGIVRSSNYRIEAGRYLIYDEDDQHIRTENLLVRFRPDLTIASCRKIADPDYPHTGYPVTGLEDCRLRPVPGGLGVSATVRDVAPFDGRCRIGTANLDLDEARFTDLRVLSGLDVQEHEKNWMPFMGERGGWLYAAWASGHVVTVDPSPTLPGGYQIAQRAASPMIASEFRGGSQLIPFAGGWLGLVHEVAVLDNQRVYEHRWVWLDDGLRLAKVSPWFAFREPRAIEFAAGLAQVGDRLVASFGVWDAEAWVVELPAAEIEGLLHDVAVSGQGLAGAG
jgi:predicted GH43/DUF377 family glycosyl hydrolase